MQIGIIFSNSSNIGNIQKAILYLGHEPVLVSDKTTQLPYIDLKPKALKKS